MSKRVTGVKPASWGKGIGSWEPRCYFCHKEISGGNVVATPTEAGKDGWPTGVLLWVCGRDCPDLPGGYFANTRESVLLAISKAAA